MNNIDQAVREFLEGVVAVRGFPPVHMGETIDWAADPFAHPSWRFRFHSLTWLVPFFECAEAQERVRDILLQWFKGNPPSNPPSDFSWSDHSTALRAEVYATAAQKFPDDWIIEALERHGTLLSDPEFYEGEGNHALDQSIALHKVGAVLGREDWLKLAEERMNSLAIESIDDQGVTNEGSVHYQLYNWQRYGAAIRQVQATGREIPAGLARQGSMASMLAHATRPDGCYETIGDTFLVRAFPIPGTPAEYAATQGKRGRPPGRRVAVFDAGYVFGRSGWGERRAFEEETFYSLRFGPGEVHKFHRHADHTSITWHPRGVPVLVDTGYDGYAPTSYRFRYSKAPEGHNVVVVRGGKLVPTRETSLLLVSVRDRDREESYHVFGGPYVGVHRHRRVLFVHEPPVVVVRDDLVSKEVRTYDQLWHVAPDLDVTVDRNRARITGKGLTVHMLQVCAGTSMSVVKGHIDPYQGWVSWNEGERQPSPTIVATEEAATTTFLTVFAAAARVNAVLMPGGLLIDVDHERLKVAVDDPMRVSERWLADPTDARRNPTEVGHGTPPT